MRLLFKNIPKRQLLKFLLLLIGGVLLVGTFDSHRNYISNTPRTNDRLERSLEIGDVAVKLPTTKPRKDPEQLVLDFVINRKSRARPGNGALVYTRKNMPGYYKRRNWHWTLSRLGEYDPDAYAVSPDEVPEQRLPLVFVLGVSYGGWDIISEYLKTHPHIVPVSTEVRYFDLDENLARGLDWYKTQMPLSFGDQLTVDMNPFYFWDHRSPRKVYKLNKNMKFVLVLRDPVQRILSMSSKTEENEALGDVFTFGQGNVRVNTTSRTVNSGIYVKFIKRWLEYFPSNQFYITDYTELITRPAEVMKNLETFLAIPQKIDERHFYLNNITNIYCIRPFHLPGMICPGTIGAPLKIEPSKERLLYTFYREYNNEMFSLLGRRFMWRPAIEMKI